MKISVNTQSTLMRHFSTLAGSLQKLPKKSLYRVEFKSLLSNENIIYRNWTRLLAIFALLTTILFAAILFQPTHWIIVQQPDSALYWANAVMLGCLILLQIFIIFGALSATHGTLRACNPVPVRPPRGLRVAFVTTRAPGEPFDLVKKTLEAAKRVKYGRGSVDVWLLDETNDHQLKQLCESIGVKHFSRKGIYQWNTKKNKHSYRKKIWLLLRHGRNSSKHQLKIPNPYFAAKTKHGNFNAWRRHLQIKNYEYDILAGVDTDHVPEPNYLNRMLGYYRDPNIAYVVGPQVYGNYSPKLGGLVCRWAESQASFFQSTIQRAGNFSRSPMFVGTNYTIRFSALNQIGGFQPCITEDMATGLAIHAAKNPKTGKRWESVYTPDVLAIGEGPALWGSFFTQQWRWAAGTFDTWRRVVWRMFFRLRPNMLFHYFMMLTFYPMAALTWLLAVASSLMYLFTGATAILAPWRQFVSLYLMGLVLQLSLYFWNRRNNVSPHEPAGSWGVSGMAASALTAPVYFSALMGIMLGKKPGFVVTEKGSFKNIDHIPAFRSHLIWATILIIGLIFGLNHQHNHPAMLIWIMGLLIICTAPALLALIIYISTYARETWQAIHLKSRQGTDNA